MESEKSDEMALHSVVGELDRKCASLQNDPESYKIQAAVEKMVTDLISSVAVKEPRFAGMLIKSGSFYDGTKIIQADEFDFLWCIKQLSHLVDDTAPEKSTDLRRCQSDSSFAVTQLQSTSGNCDDASHTKPYVQIFCKDVTKPHVFVKIVNESDIKVWGDCLDDNKESENLLDAGKMKRQFFFLIESSLPEISIDPSLRLLTSTGMDFSRMKSMNLRGSMQFGVPETFQFLWKETRRISVDISVCIQLDHWPGVADIAEKFDLSSPKFSFYQEVIKTGFLVVPKIDIFWRLSVVSAEKYLLKYITEMNPPLIMCYKAMKYLNETHFVNENENVKLTDSYVLKTILFHYWMKKLAESSDSIIVIDNLGEALLEMFKMLNNAMVTENLPQLFNSRCNVMKSGPWTQNCAKALSKCIYQLQTLPQGEVLQTLKDSKIEIDSPPRKRLSDYKIKIIK